MQLELLTLSEAAASFKPFIALGLFILYMFVEVIDSGLVFSLTQHRSAKTATLTFILYFVIGIEVFAFISNYLYILPIAFGAALGSYLVVENEKKKRPLKK